eukprot:3635346-Rhodomonas_salina.3
MVPSAWTSGERKKQRLGITTGFGSSAKSRSAGTNKIQPLENNEQTNYKCFETVERFQLKVPTRPLSP